MEKLISIGDLFKKSFELYKTKVWALAGVVWINLVYIPIFLFMAAPFAYIAIVRAHGGPVGITWYLVLILAILIGILVAAIVGPWAHASILLIIKGAANSSKEALRLGWSKLPSLLWIYFLVGLVVCAGFLLLIIPGIIFSIWFSFAIYVYIFENLKGTAALKASKQLVSGRAWVVFGRLLIMWLVAMVVGLIFRNLAGQLINMFIVTPFSLVYMYLLYEDLKRTKNSPTVAQVV